MLKILSFLLCSFVSITLYAQDLDHDKFPMHLSADDYQIHYPENWTLDTSGIMNTTFLISSPLTSVDDKFAENINFLRQDISAYNLDLAAYVAVTERQLASIFEGSQLYINETVGSGDDAYQRLSYKGEQVGFDLQFMQYVRVFEGEALILTFTAEEDQFDTYQAEAESIMKTFSIK